MRKKGERLKKSVKILRGGFALTSSAKDKIYKITRYIGKLKFRNDGSTVMIYNLVNSNVNHITYF